MLLCSGLDRVRMQAALERQKEPCSVRSVPRSLLSSLFFPQHSGSTASFSTSLPPFTLPHSLPLLLSLPLFAFPFFWCSQSCQLLAACLLLPSPSVFLSLCFFSLAFTIFFLSLSGVFCRLSPRFSSFALLSSEAGVLLPLFGNGESSCYPACASPYWLHARHLPRFSSARGTQRAAPTSCGALP